MIPKNTMFEKRIGKMCWFLPVVVEVEDIGPCRYEVKGFREPKAGEYYLSGNPVECFLTRNNLSSQYLVVEPGKKMKLAQGWVPEQNCN